MVKLLKVCVTDLGTPDGGLGDGVPSVQGDSRDGQCGHQDVGAYSIASRGSQKLDNHINIDLSFKAHGTFSLRWVFLLSLIDFTN